MWLTYLLTTWMHQSCVKIILNTSPLQLSPLWGIKLREHWLTLVTFFQLSHYCHLWLYLLFLHLKMHTVRLELSSTAAMLLCYLNYWPLKDSEEVNCQLCPRADSLVCSLTFSISVCFHWSGSEGHTVHVPHDSKWQHSEISSAGHH